MRLPSVKQAFAIHLIISVIIFLVLLYLMMRVWFPDELFFIDGGWQGLKLIAPIDLVLGPALTLLLYRPWKNKIAFDMSVIVAVQTLALGYGVYSAYNQRTAAIVFGTDGRFETVSLHEIRAANKALEALDQQPTTLSEFGNMPVLVYAKPYENFGKYLEEILNGLPELRERSNHFVPIDRAEEKIAKFRINPEHGDQLVEIPASSDAKTAIDSENHFKLKARYGQAVITLKHDDFEIRRIGH